MHYLGLVFIEKHVRNAVSYRKLSARLGAHQATVDELNLEEGVVRLLEKVLLVLV